MNDIIVRSEQNAERLVRPETFRDGRELPINLDIGDIENSFKRAAFKFQIERVARRTFRTVATVINAEIQTIYVGRCSIVKMKIPFYVLL